MIEQWLPVKDFDDCYEISNFGNCRSIERVVYLIDGRVRTFPSREMTTKYNSRTGYIQQALYRGNKCFQKYAHRMVAESFIPNSDGSKKFVNHLDGNRTNNIVTNLSWCTSSENIRHAYATGLAKCLSGEDGSNAKITWQAVEQLRDDVWRVIEAWSEENGVHTQTAWDVISSKTWVGGKKVA